MSSRQESVARLVLHRVLPTQAAYKKELAQTSQVHHISSLLSENEEMLIKLLGEKVTKKIRTPSIHEEANREYELLLKSPDIKLLFFKDEGYPSLLNQCMDFPLLLYKEGNASLSPKRSIAIVGTRNASVYALQITAQLIEQLAPYQPTIISGLAYGIDAQAHKKALENNLPTIAVLGSGLHQIYPQAHHRLAREIVNAGALISEYTLTTPPEKYHFPLRNRIIAGMSGCTLVIESDTKGGAMITAYVATSYHREVMTIPHTLASPNGKGCHLLVKKNIAHLVESAEDIASIMGWGKKSIQTTNPTVAEASLKLLSKSERKIYEYIQANPGVYIDSVAHAHNIPINEATMILLQLELQQIVIKQLGNTYTTTASYT